MYVEKQALKGSLKCSWEVRNIQETKESNWRSTGEDIVTFTPKILNTTILTMQPITGFLCMAFNW